jgi:hypothetical protein
MGSKNYVFKQNPKIYMYILNSNHLQGTNITKPSILSLNSLLYNHNCNYTLPFLIYHIYNETFIHHFHQGSEEETMDPGKQ